MLISNYTIHIAQNQVWLYQVASRLHYHAIRMHAIYMVVMLLLKFKELEETPGVLEKVSISNPIINPHRIIIH